MKVFRRRTSTRFSVPEIRCTTCCVKFENVAQMEKHASRCYRIVNYKCPHCEFKTDRVHLKAMRDHFKYNHLQTSEKFSIIEILYSDEMLKRKASMVKANNIVCPKCFSSFASETRMGVHNKFECGKRVSCLWCSKAWGGGHRLAVVDHIERCHKEKIRASKK